MVFDCSSEDSGAKLIVPFSYNVFQGTSKHIVYENSQLFMQVIQALCQSIKRKTGGNS